MTTDDPRRDSADSWRVYEAPGAERASEHAAERPIPRSEDAATTAAGPSGRTPRVALAAGAAVVLVAGAVAVGVLSQEDQLEEQPYEPILDQAALDDFADRIEEATDSTQVLDFQSYGVDELESMVPPDEPGDLADIYRWDGTTFEKWRSEKAPPDREPFDLSEIDPDVLVEADEQARDDSGDSVYDSRVLVEKPVSEHQDWIRVFVTETDQDVWVLRADLEGRVTDSSELG